MKEENKLAILEGLLFVVGDEGLTLDGMMKILKINEEEAKELINQLKEEYQSEKRGIRLHFLGNTFKLTTKEEHRDYYKTLIEDGENSTLSNSALETLAIIAYNEPITRIEVDEIRGVYSGQMIRKLVAKGLLKECGRSKEIGHPILYQTTSEFLDYFGLSTIDDLPKIETNKVSNNEEVDLYKSKYHEEIID